MHGQATDPKIGKLLSDLENEKNYRSLTTVEKAQVKEASRQYRYATIIPKELVRQLTEAAVHGHSTWVKAKAAGDFKIFAPHLENLLKLRKQEAELRCQAGLAGNLYDALLDEYEPGITAKRLTPLFADLAGFLSTIIKKVAGLKPSQLPQTNNPLFKMFAVAGSSHSIASAPQSFSRSLQQELGREILKNIGFDFHRGRIDETAHPFCTGIASDTRLTTRYNDHNPLHSLYALIHEAGHGMYTQGLPPELEGTPAGDFRSLGVHESQSLIWENCVGHSREFCDYLMPRLKKTFPTVFAAVEAEHLFTFINQVTPSLIRVDADDVTYVLHIIIRFELEQQLLTGDLAVAELPEAWNTKYEKYLGITPKHHAEGVLQDVHWSSGTFGYFPTYALGSIMSTQLFAAAKRAIPNLSSGIRNGQFAPLLDWLRQNIHQKASIYTTDELLTQATGSSLVTEPFKDFLRDKLQAVYAVHLS
jgi:carboxypeptidase Taq